jgi:hypothetical protein
MIYFLLVFFFVVVFFFAVGFFFAAGFFFALVVAFLAIIASKASNERILYFFRKMSIPPFFLCQKTASSAV